MRLPTDAYYDDRPVAHTAQGDLHEDLPFAVSSAVTTDFSAAGSRKRPGPDDRGIATTTVTTLGVVCTYTCSFVAQPPGTSGYSHPFRAVAPIWPLRTWKDMGLNNNELRHIRDEGGRTGFMYVPWPYEDDSEDEWTGHAAIGIYRPATVTQDMLEAAPRVARLSEDAQRILMSKLVQQFCQSLYDTQDMKPDMSDSWDRQA